MKVLSIIAAIVVGFILLDIPDEKPQVEAAPVSSDCSAELAELRLRVIALEKRCEENACNCSVETKAVDPRKFPDSLDLSSSEIQLAPGEILTAVNGQPVRTTTGVTTGEVVTAAPVEVLSFPPPSAGVVSGYQCGPNGCYPTNQSRGLFGRWAR